MAIVTVTGIIEKEAAGRCFLDQRGDPLFWLGDTQWELFRGYTLEEAKFTLENRGRIGFTLQVSGTKPVYARDVACDPANVGLLPSADAGHAVRMD